MASKQLGKLRQWAGEVISTRDKTTFSDEFKELEKDIELRRDGAERLFAACEAYHHALTKKKDSDALDDPEKLLPIDALGIVMIVHGEEFPEDSIYGSSLLKLGRAHCKVATLQEAYALTFQDTFLASIQRFQEDVKEYEAHRKKLESRRLSLDAAMTKVEKTKNKKEKDRREAEEEMELAKQRYDETLEDVRAKMAAIQENEIELQKELTSFLDLELNFVEQYRAVLEDVKADWPTGSSGHKRVPLLGHSTSKSGSVRSKRSTKSTRSAARSNPASGDSEDESPHLPPALSRRSSTHGRSDSVSSKPPSRPASRTSRKRTDSTGSMNGEKEKPEKSPKNRMSVSGWASSVGWGKKSKDKDQFSALDGDDSPNEHEGENRVHRTPSSSSFSRKLSKNRSKDSLPTTSPKLPPRILKTPSQQEKKLVRALYDFNGSSDELSFRVGDEIVVLNEVLDDWWMGELSGKKGLFPTSYTTVVSPPQQRKPSPPMRNTPQRSPKARRLSVSSEEGAGHKSLIDPHHDGSETSELDEEENTLSGRPLAPNASPFYLPGSHTESFISSGTEDEDVIDRALQWKPRAAGTHSDSSSLSTPSMNNDRTLSNPNPPQPPLPRRAATSDQPASLTSSGKKAPPPPPPRRSTPTPSSSSLGYDVSPFESSNELANPAGCSQFRQNPFKRKGVCSKTHIVESLERVSRCI